MSASADFHELAERSLPLALYIGSLLRQEKLSSNDHLKVLRTLLRIQLLCSRIVLSNLHRLVSAGLENLKGVHDPAVCPPSMTAVPGHSVELLGRLGEGSGPVVSSPGRPGDMGSSFESTENPASLTSYLIPPSPLKVASKMTNLASSALTGMVMGVPNTCWRAGKRAANTSWAVVTTTSRLFRGTSRRVPVAEPSFLDPAAKRRLVNRLLRAKNLSGKTFTTIAEECGLTNVYCAQLFYNQAQLKPETAQSLRKAVPLLMDEDIAEMSRAPLRSYDSRILQDPLVFRLYEAVGHYGEALKSLISEEFGDGVMSTMDFYVTLDKVVGPSEDERVVITMNGRFLPHVEQSTRNYTSGNSENSKAKS